MLLIPVLDLLNGCVVRGVAGNRHLYRPIESPLAASAAPLEVALAFRRVFGLNTVYVADLDAIQSRRPNDKVFRQLAFEGFELWVDAGLQYAREADAIFECGVSKVIAGLESLAGPAELSQTVRRHGSDRVIFSLDLKGGELFCASAVWGERSPLDIAGCAWDLGIRHIIVLDLQQVGSGAGISTLELCRRIREFAPDVEIYTGGGVRHRDDLLALRAENIAGVLVASGLHQGTITPEDCRILQDE